MMHCYIDLSARQQIDILEKSLLQQNGQLSKDGTILKTCGERIIALENTFHKAGTYALQSF